MLLPITLCPPVVSLPMGLGDGRHLPQEGQACKEEDVRDLDEGDCCAGTPCSNKAETFNMGMLESEVSLSTLLPILNISWTVQCSSC